jgi:hypothetical protein
MLCLEDPSDFLDPPGITVRSFNSSARVDNTFRTKTLALDRALYSLAPQEQHAQGRDRQHER